jgi:aminopeptidase N
MTGEHLTRHAGRFVVLKCLGWLLPTLLMLPIPCKAADDPLHALTILEQQVRVSLEPSGQRLRGESSILFTAVPGQRFSLHLNPDAVIESLTLDGGSLGQTSGTGRLDVYVPPTSQSLPHRLVIRYSCVFRDRLPQQFLSSEDPGYGISGIISLQGTFLSDASGWYPRLPSPPGRMVISVTAPAGTEAITAGRRVARLTVSDTWTSTWEIREPLPGVSLSAGPYRITERTVDGIELYTYLLQDNADLAERYLDASARHLRRYRELLGPYPFPKFAVVENFFPTGYGFPSYTLIGGNVLRLPFIVDTSLPHEIAHNWWGNGVLVAEQGGNWSEGLVTYLADYAEQAGTSATAGRDYRYRVLAEFASLVTPERDFPLRRFSRRVDPASRSIGYGKGMMLFHMVRTKIGDRAFFAGLREVLAQKLFKEATWNDFAAAFSSASGSDVAGFMAPWLERPGGPRLVFTGVNKAQQGEGWLVSGMVAMDQPIYAVPLTIRVETDSGHQDDQLTVNTPRSAFAVKVAAPPRRLLLDPDIDLFRRLDRTEIPMTVARLKGSASLVVVVTEDCRADTDTLRRLLVSLGRAGARVVREAEADTASLKKFDTLYCGIPAGTGALPSLPAGVAVSSAAFTVDRTRYDKPGDALFLVLDDPAAPDRAVVLFLPLSAAAAAASMPKITHYGRFGYLVFADGINQAKGAYPPARRADVVNFP